MTIRTVPTEALNASIVEVKLNSVQMFGMQYSLECYSVRNLTDAAASDEAYIAKLALTQLGLEAAPVEEAPAE
mgnify:CR=1 FL=1